MKRKENGYENWEDDENVFTQIVSGVMLGGVIVVLVAAFCLCLGGCSTLKTRRNAGDVRQSDAFILGELESAVSDFDGGIGRAIRESKGIADEVGRLEYLFDKYEQHAMRLRDEVNRLRAEIEGKGESNLDSRDSVRD